MANFQATSLINNQLQYFALASFEADKMFDVSGQKFLAKAEGTKYTAYLDSVGIWTIGRGITYYEDGSHVKKGDKIDVNREIALFNNTIKFYVTKVNEYVTSNVNQNQFNAIVSFTYNVGTRGLKSSSLLRKVNRNPNDLTIRQSFYSWNKGRISGKLKVIQGLVNRRKAEADLYFSK